MATHPRHAEPLSASTPTLAFSSADSALVAVAGVTGGSGASTMAHLLGAAAAVRSSVPVLLAESGGPSATLSLLADSASSLSLVDIAREVEAGRAAAEPPFTVVANGLRLIAAAPQLEREVSERGVELVCDDARAAHGLTVVDCSSFPAVTDLVALRRATHVIWCAPATDLAADRSAALFDALDLPITGRELLAIRHVDEAAVPATKWTAIAQRRDCDVVLVPHIPRIADLPLDSRIERAAPALEAIAGALR